jgi:hypothetical protein
LKRVFEGGSLQMLFEDALSRYSLKRLEEAL